MTRVLHAIPGLSRADGGPSYALRGLAGAQQVQGDQVTIVTTFPDQWDGEIADELRDLGVTVHAVGPTKTPLRWHPRIKQTVRDAVAHADVVHIHGVWEQVLHDASVAARKRNVPVVWRPCGMLDPWSLGQGRVRKRLLMVARIRRNLNAAALLHFTSHTEARSAGHLGLRPVVHVEPNGVDLGAIDDLPAEPISVAARRLVPTLDAGPMVLFLGRVHPAKSLELLIDAFVDVLPTLPADLAPTMVIAGSGDEAYRRVLIDQAQRRGLPQDRCVFLGAIKGRDKAVLMNAADAFALPSQHENFGIAVAEAMCAGAAVLVSPEVDLSKFVREHDCGEVVPREVDPWAAALQRVLSDTTWCRDKGELGRRHARDAFDWAHIASRWRQTYGRLVTG